MFKIGNFDQDKGIFIPNTEYTRMHLEKGGRRSRRGDGGDEIDALLSVAEDVMQMDSVRFGQFPLGPVWISYPERHCQMSASWA